MRPTAQPAEHRTKTESEPLKWYRLQMKHCTRSRAAHAEALDDAKWQTREKANGRGGRRRYGPGWPADLPGGEAQRLRRSDEAPASTCGWSVHGCWFSLVVYKFFICRFFWILHILFCIHRRAGVRRQILQQDEATSEFFNNAGRTMKTNLAALVIDSQWT